MKAFHSVMIAILLTSTALTTAAAQTECATKIRELVHNRPMGKHTAPKPRVDSPVSGKALVYLIGAGTRLHKTAVVIDGEFIGVTGRDDYLAAALDPGVHHLCMSGANVKTKDALLQLTVEADHSYYVRQELDSAGGFALLPPRLTLLDGDQAQYEMHRVKPAH